MSEVTYVMLRIVEAEAARSWLKEMVGHITPGDQKPAERRLQLAFTASGLRKLGAFQAIKHGLSVELVQGMTTEWKSRILGDMGESGPDKWEWGGPNTAEIDLVLMVFTPDVESMEMELGPMDGELGQSAAEEGASTAGVGQPKAETAESKSVLGRLNKGFAGGGLFGDY